MTESLQQGSLWRVAETHFLETGSMFELEQVVMEQGFIIMITSCEKQEDRTKKWEISFILNEKVYECRDVNLLAWPNYYDRLK